MKIYIQDLKNINEEKIKKKFSEKNHEIISILAKRGIYKIKNKSIFLYKIKNTITRKIKLKAFTLLCSNVYWEKKEENKNIPFDHYFLKKKISEYTVKNDFKIIIEKIKDKISDFYFDTKIENIEEIEKIICSLLSILN